MRAVKSRSSPPITKYAAHSHCELEIVCQVSGEVVTEVGGASLILHTGDVLVIPAGIVHSGRSDSPFSDLSLRVSSDDFRTVTLLCDRDGKIASLIKMIDRIFTEGGQGHSAASNALAAAVIELIRYELGTHALSPEVEEVRAAICSHIDDASFSLSGCIASTGFDSDYFRRRFKAEIGKTPLCYLTDLRIERARQLLLEEHYYPVESVARSCGFSDPLYFSTVFKKHVGVSPQAYRKTVQE